MPFQILPVDLRFCPPPPTDEGIDYTNLAPPPPPPPIADEDFPIPIFTWPAALFPWTPQNVIDEGTDTTNLFIPPPAWDDGNELPVNLISPRGMSRTWIGWTPVAYISDEIQSYRTRLIDEV